jgi:hypothetical protein
VVLTQLAAMTRGAARPGAKRKAIINQLLDETFNASSALLSPSFERAVLILFFSRCTNVAHASGECFANAQRVIVVATFTRTLTVSRDVCALCLLARMLLETLERGSIRAAPSNAFRRQHRGRATHAARRRSTKFSSERQSLVRTSPNEMRTRAKFKARTNWAILPQP